MLLLAFAAEIGEDLVVAGLQRVRMLPKFRIRSWKGVDEQSNVDPAKPEFYSTDEMPRAIVALVSGFSILFTFVSLALLGNREFWMDLDLPSATSFTTAASDSSNSSNWSNSSSP